MSAPAACALCGAPLPSHDARCEACTAREDVPAPGPRAAPRPAAARPAEAPLELARVPLGRPAVTPEPLPAPPAPRAGRRPRWLGPVLALALLAAAGVAVWRLGRPVEWTNPRASPGHALLSVTSEPSGATVRVNGQALGVTPLYVDNVWPEGQVPIVLERPGPPPRRWQGSFPGGRNVRIEAQLR